MDILLICVYMIAVYLGFSLPWLPVFRKAGEPAWRAVVPFAKAVSIGRLAGRPPVEPFLGGFYGHRARYDVAEYFGKSKWFGLGLVFLPSLFLVILGFGDAQYLGPDCEATR